MVDFDRNFIGGERVVPCTSDVLEVRFSYDNALVGTVPLSGRADVDMAVAAARRAFDEGPWPRTTPGERQAVLAKFSHLHAARCEEFATFICGENASPLWFALAVQQGIAQQNAAYLEAAKAYPWDVRRPSFGGQTDTVWRREAVGVVAAIIPWNAPHQSALVKLFPALLAGCPVILKLAPETALDGQFLGEMFAAAGLPEGVLSILVADRTVSEYLVTHPDVDKVAFTGSTAAGKRIASAAGAQLKRISLELGGKSANIILPDADFSMVAGTIRYSGLINAGQSCVAQTRILVPRSNHDSFVDALVADVARLKIGDPRDIETFIGPLVSERQRARVSSYIDAGIAEGATLAAGGPGKPEGGEHGAFVRPTVFSNVDNKMKIAQEEIFGPVLSVIPYDGVEQAVAIANDSPFGLAGGIWSGDLQGALDVASRLRAGTLSINGAAPDFAAPFGGRKQSGVGREFGAQGIDAYVEHKVVTV
ncbi:aldehyde dehydrogenase [Hyphomonas johnsonii]|uniref:aldehyde dehydrogenase (NAD(+)) n=1 Tax=Hyphomonas johnsonii MHS-2 TaxID=1280950 RepID=A0A059FUN3_9PROT|nr:aldehyde dehydrogenase [Hyphomonas johnsonii]KCZ94216.1 aldehyde dehydrogenase [Hyphomonas johnsonii MHS-2]